MKDAISPTDEQKIQQLLQSLSSLEPRVYDLGTPELVDGPEIGDLLAMGPAIIPCLLKLCGTESPRQVAYIVQVLGRLREPNVIRALGEVRSRYQAKELKSEWDWAVIGQCNLAIEALSKLKNESSS